MNGSDEILFVSANRYCDPYPVYPLGVSYLKTYLNKRDPSLNISVFDFNCSSADDFIALLKANTFGFICVSLRNIDDTNIYAKNCFVGWYKEIIDTVRQHSKAVVIIGGAGFSIFPAELFNDLNPDYGIKGEGEEALFDLISGIKEGNDISETEGLVYKKNQKVIINPKGKTLSSLDLSFEESLTGYYWQKSGMLNIQTKRGCPYNCIYCSYPIIDGRKVRTFDPERIIHELKEMKDAHGIDYVFFTDSVFNIRNSYNIELAEQIIKSGLKVRWGAYFSHADFEKEHLKLFRDAGLTHIEFGTDSLSDRQLKNYGKSFTVDQILRNSALCNEVGVFFAHFLIFGGYGETDETIDESFENSKLIDNTVFFPYVGMRIYPGTELFDRAVSEGRIHDARELLNPVYYVSESVTMEKLKEKAALTGKRWVFPDFDNSAVMIRLRARNKKGPLWEYLRQ
jgi:radical SAM superfamily enzyme YgiQ (UPF0313 family)